MLQSWRFHYDATWRRYFGLAFPLAVASFLALAVYAFWQEPPEGLRQKTVIVLIVSWLGSAAWWLRCQQQLVVAQLAGTAGRATPHPPAS